MTSIVHKKGPSGMVLAWSSTYNRAVARELAAASPLHKMADHPVPPRIELPRDPIIEAYKRDVDRTLFRENMKLTVEQRLLQHRRIGEMAVKLRKAGRK